MQIFVKSNIFLYLISPSHHRYCKMKLSTRNQRSNQSQT